MYKKPIVTVDAGLAEGVYAASGAIMVYGIVGELMAVKALQWPTGLVLTGRSH